MHKDYERPIIILQLFEMDAILNSGTVDGTTEDPYDILSGGKKLW